MLEVSVTNVNAVMLKGICMPGVVPEPAVNEPVRATFMTVTVPSQLQVAWFAAATALH